MEGQPVPHPTGPGMTQSGKKGWERVKARKCEFRASECVYLGHIVGSGTVKPEEDKTAAV